MTGERTLPGAGLTGYWDLGDSTWKPGMDTNLRAVSALLQLSVKTRTTALPGSPAQGDMHLVPAGAGVSPNAIALYDNGAWVYIAPRLGTRAFVDEDDKFYWWNGTAWTAETSDASATTLGGDLTGTPAAATVAKLQGRALANTAPTDGQAIVWDQAGSTWKPGAVASGGTNTYDVPIFVPDKPTASMLCARIAAVRAFDLPASLTGSVASAGVAATGSTVFALHKNTTSIGTVTFAAAGTTGTFSFASAVSFAAGDVLRIIAPGTADATLADISISFAGTRT